MTINEKINSRSYKSAVEKIRGSYSVGVCGSTRESAEKNGGSNMPAFGTEKKDWTAEKPLTSKGHRK